MTSPFVQAMYSAIKRTGRNGVGSTVRPLNTNTCEGGAVMSRYGKYSDSARYDNAERFTNIEAHWKAKPEVEAELACYLQDAAGRIRPSTICALASVSGGPERFLSLIKLAVMASAYPDMSEGFGGEAVDLFRPDEAQKADTAYDLIMGAAHGSQDWQPMAALAMRVQSEIGGQK